METDEPVGNINSAVNVTIDTVTALGSPRPSIVLDADFLRFSVVDFFGNLSLMSLMGGTNRVAGITWPVEYVIQGDKVIGASDYDLVCKVTYKVV